MMKRQMPVFLLMLPLLLIACSAQEPPSQAAEPAPAYSPQPYSTLAQVMRAINYPNSEIIFATQSEDPEIAAAAAASADPFGEGAALYGGWEQVQNAALMLSEAANLILIPGRVCENGLPVPLDKDDFQMYARGLVAAGQAAYEAALTKNMDAMVEVSGTVSDACFFCHEKYRDKAEGEMRCVAENP
jgi:hypothetical protein